MKVLITGGHGFIGQNLVVRLRDIPEYDVSIFDRAHSDSELEAMIQESDAIIHLAGVNRPVNPQDYLTINAGLTAKICSITEKLKKCVPIIYASSTQAKIDNLYGQSKLSAEKYLGDLAKKNGNAVAVYRLPGVFGKWCKPNYNSVVATFCHNIANDLPIHVDDPEYLLKIVYIDDVIDTFIDLLNQSPAKGLSFNSIQTEYEIKLGELAEQIRIFAGSQKSLISEQVGTGFLRALYSTYLTYLPTSKFKYILPCHSDERGVFVEMLKTKHTGQFSFFTALPGITRGGHYHHTKTEKFLVVKGNACFRFRHILTEEVFSIDTSSKIPTIVETIPGWSHDITNNGDDELIVMLWANEIFDPDKPDTIMSLIENEKA